MKFCIVNTPDMPTPGTHYMTTNKFASGFEKLGFQICQVKTAEELNSIPDEADTIFMISNHGIEDNWDSKRLQPFGNFKKATKILWHFHYYMMKTNIDIPFNNWILTGEHMHSMPKLDSHLVSYNFQNTLKSYHPLTFFSYIDPNKVGSLKRGPMIWDAQFVGSPYKTDWLAKIPNCFAKTAAMSTTEEDRVKSFLRSHCALGFHSDNNIANNVVVERVPEALSYGTVCLTDNPAAVGFTDGVAEFVDSLEAVKDKIKYFKFNKEAAEKKRIAGYEWVRTKGTYKHLAQSFLDKMKELGYLQ
jgi:hypothetical protein